MFSDYLNPANLHWLRVSEKDGKYSPWAVEGKAVCAEDGVRAKQEIIRCCRCGKELADLTGMSYEEIQALTEEDWKRLFPDLWTVNLPVKGFDEPISVMCCPKCKDPLIRNESPARVLFVIAANWVRWWEMIKQDKKFILSEIKKIEALEIEADPSLEVAK